MELVDCTCCAVHYQKNISYGIAMNNAKEVLAYNLKRLRLEKGFTQEKLAELTNLNFRTIGRLENAQCFCKSETLDILAKALNTSFEDLFKNPNKDKN